VRLLDLFCKAGGASMGYHRVGFEVVGVDIEPQPRYPFEFHQADAMEFGLSGFDAIHASPPCQRHSKMTKRHGRSAEHPDLVGPTRDRLIGAGVPYIIENVPGAPLVDPLVLCGSTFELDVRRHRLFETSFHVLQPKCRHAEQGPAVGVYGNPGGSSKRDGLTFGGVDTWKTAMGIDWMTAKELAQAIPPLYTHWIGEYLVAHLKGDL
jgi:hypothetical protein